MTIFLFPYIGHWTVLFMSKSSNPVQINPDPEPTSINIRGSDQIEVHGIAPGITQAIPLRHFLHFTFPSFPIFLIISVRLTAHATFLQIINFIVIWLGLYGDLFVST
jgi:hypothetical protein